MAGDGVAGMIGPSKIRPLVDTGETPMLRYAAALIAFLAASATVSAPAAAQVAGSFSANAAANTFDTARVQDLGCRLRLVNPRACVPPSAAPSQRQPGSTRPAGSASSRPRAAR